MDAMEKRKVPAVAGNRSLILGNPSRYLFVLLNKISWVRELLKTGSIRIGKQDSYSVILKCEEYSGASRTLNHHVFSTASSVL
jgi:hypothetical protein